MSLLPVLKTPRITRVRGMLSGRDADRLDAVLVMAPEGATVKTLAQLPAAARWQALHSRETVRGGTVRSTALANRRQTLAVLGYLKRDATPFETLALAGKMLKEAAGRACESIALLALASPTPSPPRRRGPSQKMVSLGPHLRGGDERGNERNDNGPATADERGREHNDGGTATALEALLAASLAQAFALPTFRSSPPADKKIQRIVLAGESNIDIAYTAAAARGNNLVRWLTALPPNKLDTRAYRGLIAELAKRHGLKMRWLAERELKRLGANAFLAVAAGNAQRDAGIAHLEYRPPANTGRASSGPRTARGGAPELALVGKGILFDTGGTNLKSHHSMLEMHTDMSGSAVALASLIALAELKAPVAADAWLAITENLIGPTAYRPQDIVTAANGVTIQVIHTDAEGRMALADTLALAGRAQPRLILDFATLTGACVSALTERMSGVFTNRFELAEKLIAAGRASGERVWPFPFDADYDSDLESKAADVLQCAVAGKGDHILAARFLHRFVPKGMAWAHVDLAAATRTGGLGHINTDITGFGVRYTLDLLLKQKIIESLK